jgi:hypothetical protein
MRRLCRRFVRGDEKAVLTLGKIEVWRSIRRLPISCMPASEHVVSNPHWPKYADRSASAAGSVWFRGLRQAEYILDIGGQRSVCCYLHLPPSLVSYLEAMYDPLPQPLHESVTQWARPEILNRLWPQTSPQVIHGDGANWDAFFAYYERECRAAFVDEGKHLGARSHEDLLRYTHLLSTEPNQEEIRRKIRDDFQQPRTSEEIYKMVEGLIKLSARILAMVNVGALRYEASRRHFIPWQSTQSLCEAVHGHFKVCAGPLTKNISFGPYFTARRDILVARIGIQWTDNLVDHLRLVQGDSMICVFHHVSFLRRMEKTQR